MTGQRGTGAGSGTGMFLLRLLAVSVALYLVWTKTGLNLLYMHLVARTAGPLVALAGHELVLERALRVSEEISLSPVVFLSLVVATAGIPWRRRIGPALAGVLILSAANVAVVFLIFISAYRQSERLWAGAEFLNLTINFFLPIMLWFILLPLRGLFPADPSRA